MSLIFGSIEEFPENSRIFLYGAGSAGRFLAEKLLEDRKDIEILGFIDDFKTGKLIGIEIYALDSILDEDYDLIVISSVHRDSLEKQLKLKNIESYASVAMGLLNIYSSAPALTSSEVDSYYQPILESVSSLLDEMSIDTIDPVDIVREVEAYNIGWDIIDIIKSVDLKSIFEEHLGCEIDKLAVYPCSVFVESSFQEIKSSFGEVGVYDDFRAGEVICESEVIKNSTEMKEQGDFDGYFITTRVPELKQHFIDTCVPEEKAIWINDITSLILKKAKKSQQETKVNDILDKISKSSNPLIFIGGKFYNNYTPTVQELEKAGFDIFIISRVPEVSHTSPNPSYHLLPFENKFILNINEMLELSESLDRGIVLIHSEGYLNPQFEGFRTLASYIYPAVIMDKIKVKKLFFLYDLVKPFYKNFKFENEFITTYKKMLELSDGLILNSNTCEASGFLKNSLDVDKPMVNYYRYNLPSVEKVKKKNSEFRIAMVGGFLDDVGDEMRTVSSYVRKIVAQKIHVHYYASTFGAKEFYSSLDEGSKKYFHIEKTIMDQQELSNTMRKYHAGWMVHNTQKISDMISSAQSQILKDLLYMFMVTTVPSAVLLFGSAGIPMVINRSMHGILDEYPRDSLIPLELSEVKNLRSVLESCDWEYLELCAENNKKCYSISHNAERLIEFIKNA